MDRSILDKYKSQEDKILISKIMDKIRFCETRNKVESTDFLDASQINLVDKFLKSQKIKNYFFTGGFEEAERKILIIYPNKLENFIKSIDLNKYICAIRITLPNNLAGEYSHRNYLGGLIKLGIKREKIGDILVQEEGADILISPEIEKFLITNIMELTRFSKSKIEKIAIEQLNIVVPEKEEVTITIPSMRLDNIVSELVCSSRNKANELLISQRVLVNYEVAQKPSKEIKEADTITIRGKGRFVIKNITGTTKKGKILLNVERFK